MRLTVEIVVFVAKLTLGKIGLAAGISTGAVYGGIKKSSCEDISIPKETDRELIAFSSNEFRDACKKCNLPIFGNNDDNWVDFFKGEVYPQGLFNQMGYLVYAADKHAPLGTKVRARQDVYQKAPCVIEEMLKDKTFRYSSSEQVIKELSKQIERDGYYDLWYSYPIKKSTSGRLSPQSIESIKSREELVGYAESHEVQKEKAILNPNVDLEYKKTELIPSLAFWTCFKTGVINKVSTKKDLCSRNRCGSAGGYEGELAERARTESLID